MRAMMNDTSYEVGIYSKEGQVDTFNPSKAVRAMVASAISGAAKIPQNEASSFMENYEFDALILDDSILRHPQPLTARERLERLIYLSDDRCITGKYVSGNKIF